MICSVVVDDQDVSKVEITTLNKAFYLIALIIRDDVLRILAETITVTEHRCLRWHYLCE